MVFFLLTNANVKLNKVLYYFEKTNNNFIDDLEGNIPSACKYLPE